jgi:adenylyl-sulfate kinase
MNKNITNNIFKQDFSISSLEREKRLSQNAKLIWFTGLSGSGKSTISNSLELLLFNEGFLTYSLDGDNVRTGISNNLGFSSVDRTENIRRVGEVAKLLLDSGIVVCASFVSPFEKDREMVKQIVGENNFIQIYVSTSLEVCEKRDSKGLYSKARKGKISNFTGISSPYEPPLNSNLTIDTSILTVEESTQKVYSLIINKLKN